MCCWLVGIALLCKQVLGIVEWLYGLVLLLLLLCCRGGGCCCGKAVLEEE